MGMGESGSSDQVGNLLSEKKGEAGDPLIQTESVLEENLCLCPQEWATFLQGSQEPERGRGDGVLDPVAIRPSNISASSRATLVWPLITFRGYYSSVCMVLLHPSPKDLPLLPTGTTPIL